jgi:hypothetical protein
MFTTGVVASVKICRGGDARRDRLGPAPDGPRPTVVRRGDERGLGVALDGERDLVHHRARTSATGGIQT